MEADLDEEKPAEPFIHRILCNLFGIFFVVLPILIFISVLNYHAEDPSFNKVSSETQEIHNILGAFGAFNADFVLSSFGLGLIIFLFIPILWGAGLLFQRSFIEWKMRIFAWFVGMLSFSCLIDLTCRSYFGRFDLPYNLTGEWTRTFSTPLNNYANYLTMLKPPYNKAVLLAVLFFISLIAFNFAAGITFKFWMRLLRQVAVWGRKILSLVVKLFKKIANIRNFSEFKEINPRYLQAKIQHKMGSLQSRREPAFEYKEPTLNAQNLASTTTLGHAVPQVFAEAASTLQTLAYNSDAEKTPAADTEVSGPRIVMPNMAMPTFSAAAVTAKNSAVANTAAMADKITADARLNELPKINGATLAAQEQTAMPRGGVSVAKSAETVKRQTINPTFDFLAEPQVMQKKTVRKITPEDIYHTEGMQHVASVARQQEIKPRTVVQEELLDVPTTAPINKPLPPVQEQRVQSNVSAVPTAMSSAMPEAKPAQVVIPHVENTVKEVAKESQEYVLPDINLLSVPKDTGAIVVDEEALKKRAAELEQVLHDFNIKGQIVAVRPGPVVTLYELEPERGTRTARVIGLSDDIARSMAVASVRMAVVSGHSTIGIEIPNDKRQTVWIRELFEDNEFKTSKNILNVALGKDIGGQHVYADLSKMPHLLVAGTTGSGKSVGVNTMILSLLYRMTPEQCRFIMIDPKQLEFSMYNGIPHLLTPVITDPAKAVVGLKWAVQEMENRYRSMALLNVRNIAGYNKKVEEMQKTGKGVKKTIQTGFDKETGQPIYEEQYIDTSPMPYIVIVVDEMADLMLVAGKEVEAAIQRLAQMARAAGIHLIMSTQRPSVDVITGVIKSNFPSRISFHVTTKIDSGTILGEKGAEQLLGMGDMLFMSSGTRPVRVHGCFVADEEVERVVEFIKAQGEPKYVAEVTAGELNTKEKDSGAVFDKGDFGGGSDEEELYRQAVEIVRADKKASTSYVQRKLRIGYNRAANLIERMEQEGIVSKQDHVGRREVLGVD